MPARKRHIAIGVGRDCVNVPPTRGVFKGDAESALPVGVGVTLLLRCDPVYVASDAHLVLPFVDLGDRNSWVRSSPLVALNL